MATGQSATELLDDLIARVADVGAVPDPPGNKWNFALGALFALGQAGHLDAAEIRSYEERIQAEATRIHEASKA